MNLTVRLLDGRSLPVSLPATATVEDLKAAIEAAGAMPQQQQRLLFAGRVLTGNALLSSLGERRRGRGPCSMGHE